ncbi:hypothetical protein ABEB36_013381 [Hypothenemus hampei]|uniref:Transport and Golgi organization protein 1 n=1 Tax=Hypothenemus hampei TaxID=57062 RepID=A0ABD1E7U8_HYPHA
MYNFKLLCSTVILLFLTQIQAEISDKRLCINEECTAIVGEGITVRRFTSTEEYLLSFGPNEPVIIYSLGAGSNTKLIGVKIKGKRGYVNQHHIRETKRLKRPRLLLPTEIAANTTTVPLGEVPSEILANSTQEVSTVTNGTQLALNLTDANVEVPEKAESQIEDQTGSDKILNSIETETIVVSEPVTQEVQFQEKSGESENEEDDDDDDDDDDDGKDDDKDDDDNEEEEEENEDDKLKEFNKNSTNTNIEELLESPTLNSIVSSNEKSSLDNPNDIFETVNSTDDSSNEEVVQNKDNVVLNTFETPSIINDNSSFNSNDTLLYNKIEEDSSVSSENLTEPNEAVTDSPVNLESINSNQQAELVTSESNFITPNPIEVEWGLGPDFVEQVTLDPVITQEGNGNSHQAIKVEETVAQNEDQANPGDRDGIESITLDHVINQEGSIDLTTSVEEITTQTEDKEQTNPGILSGIGNIFPIFNSVTEKPTVDNDDKSFQDETQLIQEIEVSTPQSVNENDPVADQEINIQLPEESISNGGDLFSGVQSLFGLNRIDEEKDVTDSDYIQDNPTKDDKNLESTEVPDVTLPVSKETPAIYEPEISKKEEFCSTEECFNRKLDSNNNNIYHSSNNQESLNIGNYQNQLFEIFSSDIFLFFVTTALAVLILIFIWIVLDKYRRERPLIARINKLEQQLLASLKENDMIRKEKTLMPYEDQIQVFKESDSNEVLELNAKLSEMTMIKASLEDQIQALEKELDTSTEVGIELNKMISEMLNSTDGSDIIKENVEQMQKRLLEQQDTINTLNETLNIKEIENRELRLEFDTASKKIVASQDEVARMVEKIVKIEEERTKQQEILENEVTLYRKKFNEAITQEQTLKSDIITLNQKINELQRISDTKVKEYNSLKETLTTLKSMKNDSKTLKSFLNFSELKAQLDQLKSENIQYSQQLIEEKAAKESYATQFKQLAQESSELREKLEKCEKDRVEVNTKLAVLNNYFKEKEDQLQKEINKYELLWAAKEGEATSTSERIKYIQEDLQNYKSQNESLKQEIINQEVELKSQISMLEKKAHENWMTIRQTERKLEEARQEATLLRNRLTMRERAISEGAIQHRIPLQQNGELPLSPPPTQSPPPPFNPRDHVTKSPLIPGIPPPPYLPLPLRSSPFIPPPPLDGMLPPPLSDMAGMPPPFLPGMFPGDHRPPPLGRMSSPPPAGGRYTPESTVYSEYDRYDRSPSPPYDSEYGVSPPPTRNYSPYNDRERLRDERKEFKRSQPRVNGRNFKTVQSSGSDNESLGKSSKNSSKKV